MRPSQASARAKGKAKAKAGTTTKAKAKAGTTAKAKAEARAAAKVKAKAQVKATVAKAASEAPAPAMAASAFRAGLGRKEATSSEASASETEEVVRPQEPHALGPLPLTSGLFHYVQWAMQHVLQPEERQALATPKPKFITIGSMCAGMGTEEMALHAISQELLRYGHSLETKSIFRAEKDPPKVAFLQRRFPSEDVRYFHDNNELSKACPKDINGHAGPQPLVDVLLCGIVCKDVSQLNNVPKSERADGTSGSSLRGILSYVQALRFEDRPKVIILECVQRLGQKRRVDPDARTGTQYVLEELEVQGYVGRWEHVSPTFFFATIPSTCVCLVFEGPCPGTCRCGRAAVQPNSCHEIVPSPKGASWSRGAT